MTFLATLPEDMSLRVDQRRKSTMSSNWYDIRIGRPRISQHTTPLKEQRRLPSLKTRVIKYASGNRAALRAMNMAVVGISTNM